MRGQGEMLIPDVVALPEVLHGTARFEVPSSVTPDGAEPFSSSTGLFAARDAVWRRRAAVHGAQACRTALKAHRPAVRTFPNRRLNGLSTESMGPCRKLSCDSKKG